MIFRISVNLNPTDQSFRHLMQIQITFLLFVFFLFIESTETKITRGCIFHNNVYIRYESDESTVSFRLQTREGKGPSKKKKIKIF